jgi:hypothetical protein
MTGQHTFLGIALGITGAMLLVKGTVSKPEAATAKSEGIDVSELYRSAPDPLPFFDDRYQRYTGVLDQLRTYP